MTDDSEHAASQAAPHPLATPLAQTTSGASFFVEHVEDDELREERYIARPWRRIPTEVVGMSVGQPVLIGITVDHISVVLSQVQVYPSGITFSVRFAPHPGDEAARAAAEDVDFYSIAGGYGSARLAERFRLGIAFDDGRSATNYFIHGPEPEATTAPDASLVICGGRGGSGGTETEHFAWPIPERGDLAIVTEWSARGLPERRTLLDGDALRAAAAASASSEIWPGAVVPPPTVPNHDW